MERLCTAPEDAGCDDLRSAAHAWHWCPDEISPQSLRDRWWPRLSREERARCDLLRNEYLRHQYVAARALCRATLSRYTGVAPEDWRFRTEAHGKPSIAAPAAFRSLRFNLTHTEGLTICLVSCAGDVGVDAEETSRIVDIEQVARYVFTEPEHMRLAGLPVPGRTARFFEQWVLHEAYCKGTGTGLAHAAEPVAIEWGERYGTAGDWQFSLYRPSANHVAAAAVRRTRGAASVSIRWLRAANLV